MVEIGYRRASKHNSLIAFTQVTGLPRQRATYLQVAVNDSVYLEIIVCVAERVHQLLGDLSP